MNILFVPSDNSDRSGAFRSMAVLADILQREYGHRVLVVLPYEGSGKTLLDGMGIRSVLIRSYDWTIALADRRRPDVLAKCLAKCLFNTVSIRKISGLIKKEQIDLVHVNTSWGYVGAAAAIRTDTPFVWHIREFLEEDKGRRICFRKWGYRLMGRADAVIAISESIRRKYAPILGGSKVKTVLNGIRAEDYYFPDHPLFRGTAVSLLMVGGIAPGKGQWMAIEACGRLKDKGLTDFTLRLVGNCGSGYADRLKQTAAARGVSSMVTFCGPSPDTPRYYREADIYLMCSRSEAFGRVTAEAMFGGCLAVGMDSGGTGELIENGKTGLLFEKNSAGDLAAKIEYAVTHKEEMRRIAKNGQNYMLQNMTAQQNAAKICAVYEDVMRRHPSAGGQKKARSD